MKIHNISEANAAMESFSLDEDYLEIPESISQSTGELRLSEMEFWQINKLDPYRSIA